MTGKLDLAVVAAQAEAVFGVAAALEENIPNSPAELVPGMKMAVRVLKATAESMMLEAVFRQ